MGQANAPYLNAHHKKIAGGVASKQVKLTIERITGIFHQFKKFAHKHSVLSGIIFWSLVGFAAATALFFPGGLASLPLSGAWLAKMSTLRILPVGAAISTVGGALWPGVLKPACDCLASKLLYPFYNDKRVIHSERPAPSSTLGSAKTLLSSLSSDSGRAPKNCLLQQRDEP